MMYADGARYYRKIIRIKAVDSPNVRAAMAQQRAGIEPTGEMLVPGVLPWWDYVKRRETWDPIRQCIGLDAEFYEGRETLLFPPEWLNRAEMIDQRMRGLARRAEAIGVDPAQGGDSTSIAVVDRSGLIELITWKTPDTSDIAGVVMSVVKKYNVPYKMVAIDRGGDGVVHADYMRKHYGADGIRTIPFGGVVSSEEAIRKGKRVAERVRVEEKETRYAYKDRRAEMFGDLSLLLDPSYNENGFGIPAKYTNLRRELAPIPKLYSGEGRLELPPKDKKPGSTQRSLIDIIGHSPDEADALVLAVHAMLHPPFVVEARFA